MKTGWRLINGERRSEDSTSFNVPPRADRVSLQPGDYAKVGVEFVGWSGERFGGERFWVRVVAGGGPYRGMEDQSDMALADRHGVMDESTISFGPEHVLDCRRKEERV